MTKYIGFSVYRRSYSLRPPRNIATATTLPASDFSRHPLRSDLFPAFVCACTCELLSSAAGVRVHEASAAHRLARLRAQHNGAGGLRVHIRLHQVRTRVMIPSVPSDLLHSNRHCCAVYYSWQPALLHQHHREALLLLYYYCCTMPSSSSW